MKPLRNILLSGILLVMSISCCAQRTFSEVSTIKGVTSVFIGKTMLRLGASSIGNGGIDALNGIDMSQLIKNLDSIEIITYDKKDKDKVQKLCDKILSKFQFEVLTEVIQDGEKVEISGVFNKNGRTMNMLLISVSENNERVYILMKGKIDLETLNGALQFQY